MSHLLHALSLLAPAVAVAPLSEEHLFDPLGALSASQLMDRLQILDKQGSVMADDEIHFHVTRVLEASGRTDIAFLDPLLATEGTHRPVAKMIQESFHGQHGSLKAIASAVWVDKHWVPFFWTWTSGMLLASSWDVVRDSSPALALLRSCALLLLRLLVLSLSLFKFFTVILLPLNFVKLLRSGSLTP